MRRFIRYAFVERFIQSIQQECLDGFVVFLGETHMDRICEEFLEHYHTERPHQGEGIDNEILCRPKKRGRPRKQPTLDASVPLIDIQCSQRLGGLLKSYWRKAGLGAWELMAWATLNANVVRLP